MKELPTPAATEEIQHGPVLIKVLAFSFALTLLFTLVANILPQIEGESPVDEEIQLGALTMDSFVALGERVFRGKGTCTLCHNSLGRAPDLLAINVVEDAKTRLADKAYKGEATDVEAYLRESMLAPSAYVVKGFGKKGSNDSESPMPKVDKPPLQLGTVEIDAVIAFLQSKDGNDVTVALPKEGADVTATADKAGAAAAALPPPPAATAKDVVAKYGCAACHTMLGTQAAVGPSLEGVGKRLDVSTLRESIVNPGAAIAEGFPPGVMPTDFAERMTVSELDLLVSWLAQSK